MATRGAKLDAALVAEIRRLRTEGLSIRRIAEQVELSGRTVHKYARTIPKHGAGRAGGMRSEEQAPAKRADEMTAG